MFARPEAPKGSQGSARAIWGKHPPKPVTRSRAHYKRRARAEASGLAEGRRRVRVVIYQKNIQDNSILGCIV